MSEQDQQIAQKDSSAQAAEIAAVAAVLAAGPPLLLAVQAISAAVKKPAKLILGALTVMKYKPGKKTAPAGEDIVSAAHRKNRLYRAAYLLNAATRLASADDFKAALEREKKLFAAHLEASKRRIEAAKKSQAAADRYGPVLGWGGILDDRTTPDCRWLIGKNYQATKPPGGLHPGARHARCRCFPVPPHPGKPVITSIPSSLGGNTSL
jgi:hypothetical protein